MRNVSEIYEWFIREKKKKSIFTCLWLCVESEPCLSPWRHQSPQTFSTWKNWILESRLEWSEIEKVENWEIKSGDSGTCRTRTCWIFPTTKKRLWRAAKLNEKFPHETRDSDNWNFTGRKKKRFSRFTTSGRLKGYLAMIFVVIHIFLPSLPGERKMCWKLVGSVWCFASTIKCTYNTIWFLWIILLLPFCTPHVHLPNK